MIESGSDLLDSGLRDSETLNEHCQVKADDHQPESRMREIRHSGSEGWLKSMNLPCLYRNPRLLSFRKAILKISCKIVAPAWLVHWAGKQRIDETSLAAASDSGEERLRLCRACVPIYRLERVAFVL